LHSSWLTAGMSCTAMWSPAPLSMPQMGFKGTNLAPNLTGTAAFGCQIFHPYIMYGKW
jgi:hypothetical protein